MLVEAVGLLMGGRASADLIRTGESQAQRAGGVRRRRPEGRHYEATVKQYVVPSFRSAQRTSALTRYVVPTFRSAQRMATRCTQVRSADLQVGPTNGHADTVRSADLQVGPTLIVRRDINAQGRSRAFLNDTLVTAAALSDAAAPLVELHGQHEHQTLLDPQSHLLMLDEFAGLVAARTDVGAAFRAWKKLQSGAGRVSHGRARKSRAARSAQISDGRNREREASRRRGRGARNDAPRAEQRRQVAAALRRRVRRAV